MKNDSPNLFQNFVCYLRKLLGYEAKDIYWVEKAFNKAIPKITKNVRSKAVSGSIAK